MKKIIYFLTIACVAGTFLACNKLLETAPTNKISSGTMWTTESLVDQGVIGVYYSLQRPVPSDGIVGEGGVNMGYYGFEAFGMSGQGEYALNNLFSSNINPNNNTFNFMWKWFYDGIHRSNDAIAHIPGAPMNDAKKSRLVAECKVLRGFFYMRLNELFGREGLGVPLYTEPIDPSQATKGQSPEADVWAQVIQDLTDAINEPNLPNNQIQGEGRMSKGAAYALRGRAYLITKKYDLAVADFAKVGEMGYKLFANYRQLFKVANERCEEMIMSVQYIEEPDGYGSRLQKYCAAWSQGAKDGAGCWTDLQATPAIVNLYEVIVDNNTVKPFNWTDFFPQWNTISAATTANRKVFFIRDQKINGTDIHATVTSLITGELNKLDASTRALYLPEGNEARLKAAYANRDPRLAYNIVTPYSDYKGVNSTRTADATYTFRFPANKYYADQASAEPNLRTGLPATYYTSGTCNAQAEFKYIHRKFVGEGLEYARRQSNPVDEPIIRYADVLLLWAEALVEMNDLNGAMAKVKQVRDRVGIPTMSSSFASQTAARNYVRDERRREFVNEGVNFFDEMRWKTLKETKYSERVAQHAWGGTENTGGTTYEWVGDYFYTWPVPKAEVELNRNLTPTPGWVY